MIRTININGKTYKLSYKKVLKILINIDKKEKGFIHYFTKDRTFFYVLLYNRLAGLITLYDILNVIYPKDIDNVSDAIYSNKNYTDIFKIITDYNDIVTDIIKWCKENEDYIQNLI